MTYFPLFVDLKGKNILVVGGGKIAERRVKALLGFGCRIVIASPDLGEGLSALVGGSGMGAQSVCWRPAFYDMSILIEETPAFVLAAAPSGVNDGVVRDCHAAGIPVNDASDKSKCDFYFPGLVREGEAVIGVTSGGSDHRLAARLTEAVRQSVGQFFARVRKEEEEEREAQERSSGYGRAAAGSSGGD